MRLISVEISCDHDKECTGCAWLTPSEPPAQEFLRCTLFNRILVHRYNDENKKLIGQRCPLCRQYGWQEPPR